MKKKLTGLCVSLVLCTGLIYAEIIDSAPFAPVTPEVIGQGGSFTAIAHGYNSLFTNPAGFSREGGSFTLLSAALSPYFFPGEAELADLKSAYNGNTEDLGGIDDLIRENGFGADFNSGLALVGRGLGLGLVGNVDVYGGGDSLLGTTVDVVRDWAVIAGYSVPIDLGSAVFHVGGDVRYMMRAEIPDLPVGPFIEEDSEPVFDIYSGGGLALDFGIITEYGPWSVGASFRDIGGTTLDYRFLENQTTDDMGSLIGFNAKGYILEDKYAIPMVTSYGIAWDPDGFLLPAFLFDPVFHGEYRYSYYQGDQGEPTGDAGDNSFWTGIHLGAEAEILSFIKLRGGFNEGYATFGAGVKLLFLDLNASYFVRETGQYAGEQPNEGFSIEAALRF